MAHFQIISRSGILQHVLGMDLAPMQRCLPSLTLNELSAERGCLWRKLKFCLIVCRYAMFLFSKQHEELVGIYASQLARHRCIDLFVHMMELRLNSRQWWLLTWVMRLMFLCIFFLTKVYMVFKICRLYHNFMLARYFRLQGILCKGPRAAL